MFGRPTYSPPCFLLLLLLITFSIADDTIRCPEARYITPAYGFGTCLNRTLEANKPGVHYAFYCTADFTIKPSGDARICQDDGTWSGVDQKCELNADARCSDPTGLLPPHAIPDSVQESYPIFHVFELSCATGFVGRGNTTVQCDYLKTWQIDFECVATCPAPPLPPHASISTSGNEAGFAVEEEVPVICEDGYGLLGIPTIICSTDKVWDIKFGCCEGAGNLKPGLKSFQQIYEENSIIIFGPLLFLMFVLNAILIGLIMRMKKKRMRTGSRIQVSPAKTPEALSVHKDLQISISPQPSPPLSIRDIRSQGLVVANINNSVNVIRDSPYQKLSREQSYNHQYDYAREETF